MMEVSIHRVSISLPCRIPVMPGTSKTDAPLEDRIEYCATDAWWFVGAIPTCDEHLRVVLRMMGDDYDAFLRDFIEEHPMYEGRIPNETERLPWNERHRYETDIMREAP